MGAEVDAVARRLGLPLMPWQRHVADVALELDDDGRLVHDEVVLTIPRQNGKTTLVASQQAWRCVLAPKLWGPQSVVYTAQTRNAAHQKWEREHLAMLRASRSFVEVRGGVRPPVKPFEFRARLQRGDEHFLFGTGSTWGIDAPTKTAGHGSTLDQASLDEAFSLPSDDVEQAVRPAMATRQSPQMWVFSTAGDDTSFYLWRKVKAGRSGGSGRTAYFEWSAHPDDDIGDERVWWATIPALGKTITVDFLRSELEKARREGSEDMFRRGYLNQWVKIPPDLNALSDRPIDPETWALRADASSRVDGSEPKFAVDVAPGGGSSSIGVCGRRADGRWHVALTDADYGTGWVVDRVAELVGEGEVWLDPRSEAAGLVEPLHRAGVAVRLVKTSELTSASALLAQSVKEDQVRHADQGQLNDAVGGSLRRRIGDAWTWNRRDVTVDISPLMAVTLALAAAADDDGGDIADSVW